MASVSTVGEECAVGCRALTRGNCVASCCVRVCSSALNCCTVVEAVGRLSCNVLKLCENCASASVFASRVGDRPAYGARSHRGQPFLELRLQGGQCWTCRSGVALQCSWTCHVELWSCCAGCMPSLAGLVLCMFGSVAVLKINVALLPVVSGHARAACRRVTRAWGSWSARNGPNA